MSSLKKRQNNWQYLVFALWAVSGLLRAQEGSQPISPKRTYIIGGIEVTGLQSYNEQTVKTFAGFREGQFITLPSEEVSSSIKKLWNLELFSDVALYYTEVRNDSIFLELAINSFDLYTLALVFYQIANFLFNVDKYKNMTHVSRLITRTF